jgi:hypothetical protein
VTLHTIADYAQATWVPLGDVAAALRLDSEAHARALCACLSLPTTPPSDGWGADANGESAASSYFLLSSWVSGGTCMLCWTCRRYC